MGSCFSALQCTVLRPRPVGPISTWQFDPSTVKKRRVEKARIEKNNLKPVKS